MVSGQWYLTGAKLLSQARAATKIRCQEINQLLPDSAERLAKLQTLLPNVSPSSLSVGKQFYCDYGVNIFAAEGLSVGDNVVMLDASSIRFDKNVTLEDRVVISALTHHKDAKRRAQGWQQALPVMVGENVVLGAGVTICPGAIVPANTHVQAGTVVTAPRNF